MVSRIWEAAVEAAEEAVLNALTSAPTMEGVDDRIYEGIPLERLVSLMQKYKRL